MLDLRENADLQGPECMDIEFVSSTNPKYT